MKYPFKNDFIRLFSAVASSSEESTTAFAAASIQKWMRRQVDIMDRKAKESENSITKKYKNAVLLTTYGHILLLGTSYMGAIGFYLRAYHLCPQDPLINLCIGVAYMCRAMQRKTENRHLQLMQAFTFLFRYYRLRSKDQEATFNIARAYHHIGIVNLATEYYEKVLSMSGSRGDGGGDEVGSMNLKREAAYNLSLIYTASGSKELAQIVLRKHCTI